MNRKHRDLPVWRDAVELVVEVYRITRRFPREELFGLAAQMRRAAISVPANIAEGAARSGPRELVRFLAISAASLSELDTHVEIAVRLGYVDEPEQLMDRLNSIGSQLVRIQARLKSRSRDA